MRPDQTAQPKKRGRPRATGDAAAQVRVYSWLTPSEVEWLTATFGSAYAGIQRLVRENLPAKKPEKQGKSK